MIKYLVVIGVIAFIYYVFIKKKPIKNKLKDDAQTNEMVECEKCGIYCELDEAILSGGKYYCSVECLKDK